MDKLKAIIKKTGKQRVVVSIGIIGIALILLSEVVPNNTVSNNDSSVRDYSQYVNQLEKDTASIISSISGVGKCKIMITLVETDENVFAQNTDESFSDSSNSSKSEYVLYEDNNNDTPILIKQYLPKVNGVAVVCQGGDNVAVRQDVICAISSLYNLPSNKISVSKMNR